MEAVRHMFAAFSFGIGLGIIFYRRRLRGHGLSRRFERTIVLGILLAVGAVLFNAEGFEENEMQPRLRGGFSFSSVFRYVSDFGHKIGHTVSDFGHTVSVIGTDFGYKVFDFFRYIRYKPTPKFRTRFFGLLTRRTRKGIVQFEGRVKLEVSVRGKRKNASLEQILELMEDDRRETFLWTARSSEKSFPTLTAERIRAWQAAAKVLEDARECSRMTSEIIRIARTDFSSPGFYIQPIEIYEEASYLRDHNVSLYKRGVPKTTVTLANLMDYYEKTVSHRVNIWYPASRRWEPIPPEALYQVSIEGEAGVEEPQRLHVEVGGHWVKAKEFIDFLNGRMRLKHSEKSGDRLEAEIREVNQLSSLGRKYKAASNYPFMKENEDELFMANDECYKHEQERM